MSSTSIRRTNAFLWSLATWSNFFWESTWLVDWHLCWSLYKSVSSPWTTRLRWARARDLSPDNVHWVDLSSRSLRPPDITPDNLYNVPPRVTAFYRQSSSSSVIIQTPLYITHYTFIIAVSNYLKILIKMTACYVSPYWTTLAVFSGDRHQRSLKRNPCRTKVRHNY